jgi:hypothetical protein
MASPNYLESQVDHPTSFRPSTSAPGDGLRTLNSPPSFRPSTITHSDGLRTLNSPSTPMHAAGTASDPFITTGEETLPYPEQVSEELVDPPPLDPYLPFDILEAQPRQLFEHGTDLELRRKALVTEARRRWDPASLSSQGKAPDRLILSAEDSEWYTSVLKLTKSALRPLVRQSQHDAASSEGSDVLVHIHAKDFSTLDRAFGTVLSSVNQDFQDEILRLTPLPKFALADRFGRVPLSDFVQAAALYREEVEAFLKTHLLAVQSSQNLDHTSRQRRRRRTSTGTSSFTDLSSATHVTGTSRLASSSSPAVQSGDGTTAASGNSYRTSAPVRGFKELPPHLTRVERLRLNERTVDSSRISDISREFPAGRRMGDLFSPPEFPRRISDATADPPTPSSTLADAGSSMKRYRMGREFPASDRPQATSLNRPSFSRNIPDIPEEEEAEAIAETDHSIQLPSSHRRTSGTIAPGTELYARSAVPSSRSGANSRVSFPPPIDGHPLDFPRHSPHRHSPVIPHSPVTEEEEIILPIPAIRDRFYNEAPRSPTQLSQPTEMSRHSQRSSSMGRSRSIGGHERDASLSQVTGETPPERFDYLRPLNRGGMPNPGDPDGDSSDNNDGRRPGNRRDVRPGGIGRRLRPDPSEGDSYRHEPEVDRRRIAQFDNKLKPEIVDEWDGDPDALVKWIESVNILSERSHLVYEQLGEIVPTRLRRRARLWFYGLTNLRRRQIMTNWGTLREAIRLHFMNRAWMDRQKRRALEAHYRDKANPREKPTDYLYRKVELLDTVMDFTDSELIMEVMENAPAFWAQIIDTQRMRNLEDLQDAVKYHEERLEGGGISDSRLSELEKLVNSLVNQRGYQKPPKRFFKNESSARAQTSLVGFHVSIKSPPFPKDDKNVSPNGRTPESKGARPCRHCGSGKHWDPECKHAKKGTKKARANHASYSSDYWKTQDAYEDLYYASSTENEGKDEDERESAPSESDSNGSDVEDFENPQE